LRFYNRQPDQPRRLAVLPGSFNPPTNAHVELVYAAGYHVDEVLCVVPVSLPHKEYSGATLEQRMEMMWWACTAQHSPFSIAASDGGLFLDIARECREQYGPSTELFFLCGRDAAERVLAWDYGRPGVAGEMLEQFQLLVAPRDGDFNPPPEFKHRIHPLALHHGQEHVSSSEVRDRISSGQPWEHLVPESIVEHVREIYQAGARL